MIAFYFKGLMIKNREFILAEVLAAKGLMALLMKHRNTGLKWTGGREAGDQDAPEEYLQDDPGVGRLFVSRRVVAFTFSGRGPRSKKDEEASNRIEWLAHTPRQSATFNRLPRP